MIIDSNVTKLVEEIEDLAWANLPNTSKKAIKELKAVNKATRALLKQQRLEAKCRTLDVKTKIAQLQLTQQINAEIGSEPLWYIDSASFERISKLYQQYQLLNKVELTVEFNPNTQQVENKEQV